MLRRPRRVLGAVARWWPWTPLGLLVCIGALAGLRVIAHAEFDMVWLVTAHVVTALCLLSPCVVLVAGLSLRLRGIGDESQEPLRLETGQTRLTGMAMPALSLLPLVQVRVRWLSPGGVAVGELRRAGRLLELAEAPDRGRHAAIRRRYTVEDPFGIGRISFERTRARTVEIAPHLGRLAAVPSLSALAHGDDMPHPLGVDDGDRVELSRYVPGDPARYIHWKLYARTRQLMVRRQERSLSVARRVSAFMIAGEGDDASAAVARLSLTRALLGDDWTFGTDAHPEGTGRADEALAWLLDSSGDRKRGGAGLSHFVELAQRLGPTSLVLFAPPTPGPWIDAVAHAASSVRVRVRVLIGVDALGPVAARGRLARLLLRAPAPARTTAEPGLRAVAERLGALGCDVVVVDRQSGRLLGERHQQALQRGVAA